MAKQVKIRKVASEYDLKDSIKDHLNELDRALFDGCPLYPKDGSYWWFAYLDDKVVGFAGLTYYPSLKSAFLSRAGVLPEARGLGIQKRMIAARERQAVKDGYHRIVSYTSKDNVISANNLMACGYKLYIPKFEWGLKHSFYVQKIIDDR